MQKSTFFLDLLILIGIIGFGLLGWIAGDAIRHSTPELRQYPLEYLSTEELSIFSSYPTHPLGGVLITNWDATAWMTCKDEVVYTSLPAKCQSIDGRLIEVGGNKQPIMLIPQLAPP